MKHKIIIYLLTSLSRRCYKLAKYARCYGMSDQRLAAMLWNRFVQGAQNV